MKLNSYLLRYMSWEQKAINEDSILRQSWNEVVRTKQFKIYHSNFGEQMAPGKRREDNKPRKEYLEDQF